MKPFSFAILMLVLLAAAPPVKAEYLQGTVVRIDFGKREVEINLSEGGQCRFDKGPASGAAEITPDQPAPETTLVVKAAWLPGCLAPGTQVYARGQYAAGRTDLFEAEEIFPCRRRGGKDPTGVRSRFQHHRKQMMRHMGEEPQ